MRNHSLDQLVELSRQGYNIESNPGYAPVISKVVEPPMSKSTAALILAGMLGVLVLTLGWGLSRSNKR